MKTKRQGAVMSAFARFRQKQPTTKRKANTGREKMKISTPIQDLSNIANITSHKPMHDITPQTSRVKARTVEQVPHRHSTNLPAVACGNEEAENCFRWLIKPVQPVAFLQDTFEKKPLHIKDRGEYYSGIFSCKDFDRILRNHHLEYSRNIDIVVYKNGKRETLNPDGRAYASVVWDYFQNGHTIRLLNPQTYSRSVWKLCSFLQEYFGSFVGANMYLTPAGSQGFAPHYDDIEAFVLQLEGKKRWKVYAPRSTNETLPRFSSKNFQRHEIGEPLFEMELAPGDLLYFPRGFIHEAKTSNSQHSLHLTLSTYQKNTWGDLLQTILPRALEMAMEEDLSFRESVPKDYMNFLGTSSTDPDNHEKDAFFCKLIDLTKSVSKYLMVDSGADVMAKDFVHCSLPPCLTEDEKKCSIQENGERWENDRVRNTVELSPDTEIALIRKRAVQLVHEEGVLRLYHSFENSRIYKEREPQYIEIEWELQAGIKMLLNAYPRYIAVEELPLENLEQQIDLATLLYDKGVIRTRVPLTPDSEDENE